MNDQDDMDSAWGQQQLDEQRRREDELLRRAPAAHRHLKQIEAETNEIFKAMEYAIDRIFRG